MAQPLANTVTLYEKYLIFQRGEGGLGHHLLYAVQKIFRTVAFDKPGLIHERKVNRTGTTILYSFQ